MHRKSAKKEQKRSKMKRTCRFLSILLVLCFLCPLTLPARAEEQTLPNSFSDVPVTAWYASAVSYAASHGIAVGSYGRFRPNDAVTRGEFVTMLARVLLPDGFPEELPVPPFSDVRPNKFYAQAVAWAASVGITSGTSETTFSPNEAIKRQDMALMLCLAQQLPELGELPSVREAAGFADETSISRYARAAVAQLQTQGLVDGDPAGSFRPKQMLTRAEAVTVLGRIHMYMTGHTHSFEEAETIAPTCTKKGARLYRCVCGSYYGTKIAALGHDYNTVSDFDAWTVTHTCQRCGNVVVESLPGQKPARIYDGASLLTYEDTLYWVDRFEQMYPDLIHSYVGAQAVNGTDIRVVTFGKGSRYLLFNGNLHAREYITTNYLLEVLDEYAYAYANNLSIGSYQIKPLLDEFTLVIIPCCNPEGRAIALGGNVQYKANGRGVDLNWNFPVKWEYKESGIAGPHAGSEPETRMLMQLLKNYPFEMVIDCHNAGNVVYYCDDGCTYAFIARSKAIVAALTAECGFRFYSNSAGPGFGSYSRHSGVPAFTFELWPTLEHPIDCSGFYEKIWDKVATLPAIAMTYLINES